MTRKIHIICAGPGDWPIKARVIETVTGDEVGLPVVLEPGEHAEITIHSGQSIQIEEGSLRPPMPLPRPSHSSDANRVPRPAQPLRPDKPGRR